MRDSSLIDQHLNNPQKSLIEGYFDLHKHFEALYGENAIVMIELGSFFEVYGVENEHETIGKVREIADVLNIQLTRRNKTIQENSVQNPLMAGFPSATFDRYITRLIQEKKYTIILIRQKGTPPNMTRYLDTILSPGVNLEYCLDHKDNFVTSLIVDMHAGVYSVGYAAIDISTGNTFSFEGHGTKEDPLGALDELFGQLQSRHASEIIFVPGSREVDQEYVLSYLELSEMKQLQTRTKRHTVSYQNELFKRAYIVQSFLSPIEFLDLEKRPLTSEALAHLIEFIVEHDHSVIEHIKKPTIIEAEKYLYLGNNPLEQLNIVSKDPSEMTLLALFDYTTTSIGRRLYKDRLTHPITDEREIEARYDLAEALAPDHAAVQSELKKVYDLERLIRRINLGRLHPFEINFLHESLVSAEAILNEIGTGAPAKYLPEFVAEANTLRDMITYIEQTFDLDQTTKVTNQTISTSLFTTGFQAELTTLIERKYELENKIETIREKFVTLLKEETGSADSTHVQIKKPEKEAHTIIITKGRFSLIEHKIPEAFLPLDGTVYALSDFRYKMQTTNVKISADILQDISKDVSQLETQIIALVKELFARELKTMSERYASFLTTCSNALAKIDVAVSTIKAATEHRLVRPEVVDVGNEESYLSLEALRHPLVESKEERGIYVPNHVVLGSKSHYSETDQQTVIASQSPDDIRGLLLYGINSSGKSSLMKSLGIAVVLAQAGFFVPASRMRFSLCRELFTRIVSKDNFEKGLSSFAVEMMELKNIFNRSSAKSLILGDEISHGTETLSAIAIVAATIKRLTEQRSLFLFTTHLHQIYELQLMNTLSAVASVHMSVHYDKEADKLIFDRTLQAGNGSSVYGLEFAQSLHMDKQFLKYATALRKDLASEHTDIERITKKQTSKYHKDVYLSSCAICKNQVDDTHHIAPQEAADDAGNIGHIHKNHKYNLLPICKQCHNDIHAQKLIVKGFMMTSNGLELTYERQDD